MPTVSVIIPVKDNFGQLRRCLDSLRRSEHPLHQVIVVDDASRDDSVERLAAEGVTVIRLAQSVGPAEARNAGARRADADYLLFTDSDVCFSPGTVGSLVAELEEDSRLAAAFGSYDDVPTAPNFLSQYRNLLHHFVHQHARRDARTFWTGCGIVRRERFEALRGFDPIVVLDDIDFGLRLHRGGHRIRLAKGTQVTHLKRWTFVSMLSTDIFLRAIPWTGLVLREGRLPNDLNLKHSQLLSAFLAWLTVLGAVLSPSSGLARWLTLGGLAGILAINRPLFSFFRRKRGVVFALASLPVHLFFYLYSSVGFLAGVVSYTRRRGGGEERAWPAAEPLVQNTLQPLWQ